MGLFFSLRLKLQLTIVTVLLMQGMPLGLVLRLHYKTRIKQFNGARTSWIKDQLRGFKAEF